MRLVLVSLVLIASACNGFDPNAPIGEQLSGFDPSQMSANEICVTVSAGLSAAALIAAAAGVEEIDLLGKIKTTGDTACAAINPQPPA